MKRRDTVGRKGMPPQKACMSCCRNEHKVAILVPVHPRSPYFRFHGQTEILGYCPSCTPTAIHAGEKLVYDRRGERTKAAKPIAPYVPPAPAFETTEGEHGRSTWAKCGHPAERDIFDNCFTCGGSL